MFAHPPPARRPEILYIFWKIIMRGNFRCLRFVWLTGAARCPSSPPSPSLSLLPTEPLSFPLISHTPPEGWEVGGAVGGGRGCGLRVRVSGFGFGGSGPP
jgi:hypothetical protein